MATVPQRLRLIGLRLGFGLTLVAIFGFGSIGAFLPVDWPPLLRQIVLGYLMAVLIVRLALILGRVLLAPERAEPGNAAGHRVVPMSDERARYWYLRIALFVGYYAFGWVTVEPPPPLGFSARDAVCRRLSSRPGPARHRARGDLAASGERCAFPTGKTRANGFEHRSHRLRRPALAALGRRPHRPVLACGGGAAPA